MSWQKVLRDNFTDWARLADFLELSPSQRKEIAIDKSFPLSLPLRLAKKIEKGRLDDPILLQFLPLQAEQIDQPGFCHDPVGDIAAKVQPRLLQKYKKRSLLIATGACAMHCRYCFRRHFDYGDPSFEAEIEAIKADPTRDEIILSGGDPLSLSDRVLGNLLDELDQIDHIKRIRFHTRFPIGIPERITDEFLALIEPLRAQVIFVIHCNHALELDDDVRAALSRVKRLDIPLLNQSVLLAGVNDSVETLCDLNLALVNSGIMPYYLHQLDQVIGAAHFEVDPEQGLELIRELEKRLPGYAVPRYVREEPGKMSKSRMEEPK